MRRWSRFRAWWLLVIAAAGGAAAAGVARSVPAAVGVALAAGFAAVAGVLSKRSAEALEEDRRSVLDMREKLLRDRRGRLPRVRDLVDSIAVGIHGTSAGPDEPALPPFVPRDQSHAVETALGQYPLVVIVGESTAGKSRLALEAVRARLPDHLFILPDPSDRTSMLVARRAVAGHGRCVVWLDDLERYLGAGGLTAHVLLQMIADNPDAVVVATIRTMARARFASPEDGLDPGERYAGRGVFELAHEIRLDRRWSTAEVQRAQASTDTRILAALEQADRFGVAEYLAAGPRLLAMAVNAWDPEGGRTRGAALTAAAIDARRAGWYGPVPRSLLKELHEHYLTSRGGILLRPETWEAALAWATTPLFAVSSLLVPDQRMQDSYRVFDYLPDAEDTDQAPPVPEQTWTALIRNADAPTCLDLGREAHRRNRDEVAHQAFRKALDGGVLLAAAALAYLLAHSDDQREIRQAADLLRVTIATAPADTDPAEMLELRSGLSWWTGASGNADEALATAQEIWEECRQRYGADQEVTLDAGLSVARWTGHTGNLEEAYRLASDIHEQAVQRLGPDHTTTLNSRFEAAVWARHDGSIHRAIRLWRELDSDATRLLGEHDAFANDVRWNLAELTIRSGDTEHGLDLLETVVAARAVIFGHDHPRTLAGRLQLAGETGKAGRFAEALAAARQVVRKAAQALGDDHEITLYARYQVALWTAKTGDPASVRSMFTDLFADSTRLLGPDHPVTNDLHEQLQRSPDYTIDYPLPASW